MAENENEISGFSPDDDETNLTPHEYNPESEGTDDSDEAEIIIDENSQNNSDSGFSDDSFKEEKKETTEQDINLPDFLKQRRRMKDQSSESSLHESHNENNDNLNIKIQDNIKETNHGNEKTADFTDAEPAVHSELHESESKTSGEIPEESTGGTTEDESQDKRFVSKISAADADHAPKSAPKLLNKKLILGSIIGVVGTICLIVFLMPTNPKQKNKKGKPVAETHAGTDYASMARKRDLEDATDSGHYGNTSTGNEEEKSNAKNEEVEIPPVVEKKPYTNENISYNTGKGAGASSSVEIPDTRNDSLRGKSIAGIKGLTSTQESYSTDYQQTIQKNTSSSKLNNGTYSLPSKEEYMNSALNAYSSITNPNSYSQQNDQAGKNAFFNNGRNANGVGQGEWLNLNTLWQGSIFEAVLTSELNTDLPGEITARVAKNIYSSQDGRFLLIPQNSVLYGTYNSSISYSQSRVQVAWHTLIRPDGYQIYLGNMNGTDAKGASGLKGFVNDHPLAYLKAIGLMSVFSIINTEFQATMGNTQNQYIQNVMANSMEVTNELADKLIDRAMNVQPTIKIKAGTKINIVANTNLSLPPVEDIPVTQPYHRE